MEPHHPPLRRHALTAPERSPPDRAFDELRLDVGIRGCFHPSDSPGHVGQVDPPPTSPRHTMVHPSKGNTYLVIYS